MVKAAVNSLVLNSFERWVPASVTCSLKRSSIEERASNIRKSYEVAIEANIEYHTEMSRLSGDDKDSGAMHLVMAQAYRALIST